MSKLSIISSLIILSFLVYFAKCEPCPPEMPDRCGVEWHATNIACGQCCNSDHGNDDCAVGETCFSGLETDPCEGIPPPFRCGIDWDDANNNCAATRCYYDEDCADTWCFSSLTKSCPSGPSVSPANVISGCGSGKKVALTFDDGPANGAAQTQTIINRLTARGKVATFYVSPDIWAVDQEKCDLIGALTAAGMEVQSHSWSHGDFKSFTNAQIQTELDDTSNWIVNCGGAPPTIFRPPFGSLYKAQTEYIVNELGYKIGLWNMDSEDWIAPNNGAVILGNINLSLYDGDSITILMHDRDIYTIIDDIIDLFENAGYTFITQSQCLASCDTVDEWGICADTHGNDPDWILDAWRT